MITVFPRARTAARSAFSVAPVVGPGDGQLLPLASGQIGSSDVLPQQSGLVRALKAGEGEGGVDLFLIGLSAYIAQKHIVCHCERVEAGRILKHAGLGAVFFRIAQILHAFAV